MMGFFKRKVKPTPACANCVHYKQSTVHGNRMANIVLGLCNNEKVLAEAVPYGSTIEGFYLLDQPPATKYVPISFSPEFSCKHHTRTDA